MNSELEMLNQFQGAQCGTCGLGETQGDGRFLEEGLISECEFGQTELATGEGALQQGLGGDINKAMSIAETQ